MISWLWKLVKWVLFRMDAETAHLATVAMIRVTSRASPRLLSLASSPSKSLPVPHSVAGLQFLNRVGLAAGFDKNAEIVSALPALGFGFAEIGTVTPLPQPGNPRPRLFREPQTQSIFNRMGFNGLGATLVSERLAHAKRSLPPGFLVGVNLGKNKDTPLEAAGSDYAKAARPFQSLADYLVINVSSPNTPGLRSLQTADALKPILGALFEETSRWSQKPPVFLKLAPELSEEELRGLIETLESWRSALPLEGWILTNTLAGEIRVGDGSLPGGWSGGRLSDASRSSLISARKITRLPIISVGGILSREAAMERIKLGADLVQIFSGWIYRGPRFPSEIADFLAKSAP